MLIDEGVILNYLGVNIKKNSYGTFKLSQSQLVEKIINHVGLILSASLKSRETPAGKPLLNKEEYILGSKLVWNYKAEVGMLSLF